MKAMQLSSHATGKASSHDLRDLRFRLLLNFNSRKAAVLFKIGGGNDGAVGQGHPTGMEELPRLQQQDARCHLLLVEGTLFFFLAPHAALEVS